MPGLFGVIGSSHDQRVRESFGRVFTAAAQGFQSESLIDPQERWAVGRTHLGVLQPSPQLSAGRDVQVLFHGDLYHSEATTDGAGASGGNTPAAPVAASAYAALGPAFAGRLDGAFCGAIVDTVRCRALLFSDHVASYPLYWTVVDGTLVFASELRALLRHGRVARALDPRAVADYITFGFPFGTKTLAAGVQLLPAGATLTFDWNAGTVSIDRNSSITDAFEAWEGSESAYLEALEEAFSRSVGRALGGHHAFGLSLSGGLDSRAILSAVNGATPTLATYTLGIKGCADEVIATTLSRIAGTRHSFFELDDKYLKDFLPNLTTLVSLTDGMYLSHGLTEMLALRFLSSVDFSVLLRGHGGELAKASLAWPLHTDGHVYELSSTEQLVPYLLQRVNYITPGLELSKIFQDRWTSQMTGVARQSMEEALDGVSLSPADQCSYLYLMEQHRRYTIASLELFRQTVEIRLPFVDWSFLRVLLRAPSRWRDDTRLHRALTNAGDPRLLRVRNSNTGAPGNAGPLVERGFDKLNSLLKKLNVHGYRHYHNFQKWMQQQLFASVESVLLSPESLGRGVLRESGVRELIDNTRSGRSDHGHLLQTLLILELWQRENLG